MNIWAIADLHLSFGVPNKSMEIFGSAWQDYANKIKNNWQKTVKDKDLVLIAGDISWASTLEQAEIDLKWIDELPGTKVMIKGNHDYWWPSLKKLKAALPPSINVIYNNAFHIGDIAIGGSRLWDTEEYRFSEFIEFVENPNAKKKDTEELIQQELNQKVFERELVRLDASLSNLNKEARLKIAMTHYPPIGADLADSRAADILKKHQINICVFGHLHSLKKKASMFGTKDEIQYILTSADYLDFQPIFIS